LTGHGSTGIVTALIQRLPTVTGVNLVAVSHLRSKAQGTASLDQIRSRGAYRSRRAEAIELGNEPPLSVDGGHSGFVDRRRISVQWFAGTILTALCGAALMGGAVFTSLDGETNFASLPERVEVALRGAFSLGHKPTVVAGATATRALPGTDDAPVAASALQASSLAAIADLFGIVVRASNDIPD